MRKVKWKHVLLLVSMTMMAFLLLPTSPDQVDSNDSRYEIYRNLFTVFQQSDDVNTNVTSNKLAVSPMPWDHTGGTGNQTGNRFPDPPLSLFHNITFHLITQMESPRLTDGSGKYYVLPNIVTPSLIFSEPDVTLSTHGSADHLTDLLRLMKQWDGPISVAIFMYKGMELGAIRALALVMMCEKEVGQRVRLHLVYPVMMAPAFLSLWGELLMTELTCYDSLASLQKRATNFDHGEVQYPVNVLRNLALKHTVTEFVMNLDIDLIPNKSVRKDFLNNDVIWRNNTTSGVKELYVLPCFEVESHPERIRGKFDLLRSLKRSQSVPCRLKFFAPGHRATDYNKWKSLPDGDGQLYKAYEVQYEAMFEPYFIARKQGLPSFHEAFKSYGYDKNTQMCEVYMAGYHIYVLSNAYVLHPGIKKLVSLSEKHKAEMRSNFRIAISFQQYLKKKYHRKKIKNCLL